MARPNWEYIRVDVLLPDNHKLDSLTPLAKWTIVELWCYCGQHLTDGFVRDAAWRRFGTTPARASIVAAGLAERVSGGYQMHDYLDHQRSRAEVQELKAKRAKAGRRSAEARAKARASAATHAEQDAEQTGSKPATEAEAEAEAEADLLVADVSDQSSRRNPRDAGDLIDIAISEIRKATGKTVTAEWAEQVAASLLKNRDVSDPAAYLRHVIRNERDPNTRFLPVAASLPSAQTISDAVRAAGITPNGQPARGSTVTSIAAQARQAIAKGPST